MVLSYACRTLDGDNFDDLSPIDHSVIGSCLAIVDDSTLFVFGGAEDSGAYPPFPGIYDAATSEWAYVGSSPAGGGRSHPECGVLHDRLSWRVVVAGGFGSDAVDLFDNDSSGWTSLRKC